MTRFNAELFRICLPFVADREDPRKYLRGVHVEPHPVEGAILVATDGHRMIVVHDAAGQADAPAIVPWNGATKILRPTRGAERRFVQIDDGTLTIVTQDVTYRRYDAPPTLTPPQTIHTAPADLIEETFPDWRRMLPLGPFDQPRSECLDGLYLADFGRAGADLSMARGDRRGPNRGMQLLHSAAGGPVLIRWPDVDFACGMQMPRRDGLQGLSLPTFLDQAARAA